MGVAPKHRFVLGVVHFNIFLYSISFGLSLPVMPYLTETLGADPVQYGYLQTWFSLLQLLGSPLLGIFGDRYGSKAALMVSIGASAASYLLLATATNLPLLFLSRVPTLLQHGILCAQAYVTDITDDDSRAGSLGRLMFTYGIGFVCGPALGGALSQVSLRAPAYAAVAFSLVGLASIQLFMTNPVKRNKHTTSTEGGGSDTPSTTETSKSHLSIERVRLLCSRPNVFTLLSIRVLSGLASALFHSSFIVIAKDIFGLDAKQNGYLMSLFGVIMALTQGGVIGALTSRFAEHSVVKGSLVIKVICFFILVMASTLYQMVALFIPLVCAAVIISTVISSALTKSVMSHETGSILGLDMASGSACRVVAPTIGLYLLQHYGYSSVSVLSLLLSVASLGVAMSRLRGPFVSPATKGE